MSGSANQHARLAPSDSKRWMTCTAAVSYEAAHADELPKDDDSVYSLEGTEAHDWGEKVLNGEASIDDLPEKFKAPVGEYVDVCNRVAEENDGFEPFVEVEVPLFYQKDATGTCDYASVSEEKIVVVDYKHGAGVYVEVVENPQLAIYALSLAEDLEEQGYYEFSPDTEVEIRIVQPRHKLWKHDHKWTLTLHDLQAFCERIREARDIIQEDVDTVFAPGEDTCRWCKCKAICEARLKSITDAFPVSDPKEVLTGMDSYGGHEKPAAFKKEVPDPFERVKIYAEDFDVLDDETLVAIYRNSGPIKAMLSDIEEYLDRRAHEGRPADGTKLVMGREGNRAWADESEAEKTLENQGLKKNERTVTKVISVTEAEKLLADKLKEKVGRSKNPNFSKRLYDKFQSLVKRSPAKKVLALADDKRPAVDNFEGMTDHTQDGD